jgi:hypothetical protein
MKHLLTERHILIGYDVHHDTIQSKIPIHGDDRLQAAAEWRHALRTFT